MLACIWSVGTHVGSRVCQKPGRILVKLTRPVARFGEHVLLRWPINVCDVGHVKMSGSRGLKDCGRRDSASLPCWLSFVYIIYPRVELVMNLLGYRVSDIGFWNELLFQKTHELWALIKPLSAARKRPIYRHEDAGQDFGA